MDSQKICKCPQIAAVIQPDTPQYRVWKRVALTVCAGLFKDQTYLTTASLATQPHMQLLI